MTVIPSDDILLPAALVTGRLEILDHVLVGIALGIHSSLSAFDRETEGISDYDGVSINVSLHQPHDFYGTPGAGMHNHLNEGHGADPYMLEMMGIFFPRLGIIGGLLALRGVGIEGVTDGVDQFYTVVKLYVED